MTKSNEARSSMNLLLTASGVIRLGELASSVPEGSNDRFSFAIGWMRLLTITSICQGISNFALAFLLTRYLGLGAITLAMVVSAVPQLAILVRKLGGYLEINPWADILRTIRAAVAPLALASVFAELIGWKIDAGNGHLPAVLVELATFGAVYCLTAYFFTLTVEERLKGSIQISGMFRKITQRRTLVV